MGASGYPTQEQPATDSSPISPSGYPAAPASAPNATTLALQEQKSGAWDRAKAKAQAEADARYPQTAPVFPGVPRTANGMPVTPVKPARLPSAPKRQDKINRKAYL